MRAREQWATELANTFADEAQREQVAAFMESHVDPYATQLETNVADLGDAQRLYEAFTEDAPSTLMTITEELYGEDAAQAFLSALTGEYETEGEVVEGEYEDTDTSQADPRLEEMWEERESQRRADAYNQRMAEFVEENPDIDPDFFHPFVASSGGDFDLAAEGYREYATRWSEAQGAEEIPSADEIEEPPMVLGGGSPPAPPVHEQYGSLDDALDAFFRENPTSSAPPTVGGV